MHQGSRRALSHRRRSDCLAARTALPRGPRGPPATGCHEAAGRGEPVTLTADELGALLTRRLGRDVGPLERLGAGVDHVAYAVGDLSCGQRRRPTPPRAPPSGPRRGCWPPCRTGCSWPCPSPSWSTRTPACWRAAAYRACPSRWVWGRRRSHRGGSPRGHRAMVPLTHRRLTLPDAPGADRPPRP